MSSSFRKIFKAVPAVVLLVILNSCISEMEYPEEFFVDLLVVNSIIDPDSLVQVNVSHSLLPNGKVEFVYVDDADVALKLNNSIEPESFFYENLGWYQNQDIQIYAGKEYSLEVSSSHSPSISSNTLVPEKPKISDIKINGDSVSFNIIDDGSREDYYFVTLYGWKKNSELIQMEDGSYTYTEDTIYHRISTISKEEYVEAYFDGRYGWVNNLTGFTYDDEFWDVEPDFEAESFIFSDHLINGKTIEFNIQVDMRNFLFPDRIPAFELRVHKIDINYYEYLVSVAEYLTTDETPLIERAIVYNNIVGGYGVFGSQNGVCEEILFEDLTNQ